MVNAPNDIKMTLQTSGERYPKHLLTVALHWKCHRFGLQAAFFELHVGSCDKSVECTQNYTEHYKVKSNQQLKFMAFCSISLYDHPLRATGHFVTSAQNDLKITLNTLNTRYKQVPQALKIHISTHFALQKAVFERPL